MVVVEVDEEGKERENQRHELFLGPEAIFDAGHGFVGRVFSCARAGVVSIS
jgi:hypothetical protein